jgi:GIY-YIG catalytic domain/NUMOD3 motif
MTTEETRPTFIYALCEPDNLVVRYVGKTVCLEQRYGEHLRETHKTYKCNWVQSLLNTGRMPVIIELECVPAGEGWADRERRWITYYRELGFPLTNLTDGGEGTSGMAKSDEHRAKISASHQGKKMSPEAVAKSVASRRGRKVSDETKAKLSEIFRGRVFSDEHRAKLSAAALGKPGRPHTEASKLKMSKAQGGRKCRPVTDVARENMRRGQQRRHLNGGS